MLERFITMLAILAITVVTMVATGHAARMNVEQYHAMHVGEMRHASIANALSCDGPGHCGLAAAELCEFVCVGVASYQISPGADGGHEHEPVIHAMPSETSHVSLSPGLTERPPKLRLL
jgi:hypothetical protein